MEPTSKPGIKRLAAIISVWGVVSGLVGLIWLGTLEPFIGQPLTHPLNLFLLGLSGMIGMGFTIAIGWERRKN